MKVCQGTKQRQHHEDTGITIVFFTVIKTRGPRGPWVAHLRKRSKVSVEPIIREPQGHNLNNCGKGPVDDAIYQIRKIWAL